jgi:hypothetical protein
VSFMNKIYYFKKLSVWNHFFFSPKLHILITWYMPAGCGYSLSFGKNNHA